jgi:hypothetical protein
VNDKTTDCGSISIPKAALDELWTAIDSHDHAYIVEVARGIDRVAKPAPATECRSVFSDDDLRRLLEWHEEVRSTCGISADDDNLRKRIVGALRHTEQESVDNELKATKRALESMLAAARSELKIWSEHDREPSPWDPDEACDAICGSIEIIIAAGSTQHQSEEQVADEASAQNQD